MQLEVLKDWDRALNTFSFGPSLFLLFPSHLSVTLSRAWQPLFSYSFVAGARQETRWLDTVPEKAMDRKRPDRSIAIFSQER